MSMDSAEWKAAQTGAADRNGSRSLLEVAIERGEWEAAAMCLVAGIIEATRSLPPESIEELLSLLALDDEPPGSHRRRRERRRRHGRG
jgi:hypothetical protein